MNLQEIKDALKEGKKVYWTNEGYEVRQTTNGSYIIECLDNQNIIGLTWLDGTTLNGKEEQFFTN